VIITIGDGAPKLVILLSIINKLEQFPKTAAHLIRELLYHG